MKRLMRNANLRFGFGKATSGPATKGEKGSMAATEFSSTSAYSSLDRLSPLEGTAGASAAAVNRRGRGGRAAALTSTIGMMIAVVVAVMAVVAPAAWAAFGEEFGFAPINEGPDSTEAPAFPGDRAFWAGACDLLRGVTSLALSLFGSIGRCPDQILFSGGQR